LDSTTQRATEDASVKPKLVPSSRPVDQFNKQFLDMPRKFEKESESCALVIPRGLVFNHIPPARLQAFSRANRREESQNGVAFGTTWFCSYFFIDADEF
jgi:hypothetical protein